LGILQGMTEFIPVSSTAHLLIGQEFLNLSPNDAMFSFLILVQFGTLGSLFVYFWKDLRTLVSAFIARPFSFSENKLVWFILLATIPSLLAGYLLKDKVEALFRTPLLEAGIRLLITSILLFLAEWLGSRVRNLSGMKWLDALVIGIFQAIAVFPGASRSGTTISGGMLRGFDRPGAARFAFLMSIPVLLAAGFYELLDLVQISNLGTFIPNLIAGFLFAGITGWLSVRWLLSFLAKHRLFAFSAYTGLLGMIAILLYFLS